MLGNKYLSKSTPTLYAETLADNYQKLTLEQCALTRTTCMHAV